MPDLKIIYRNTSPDSKLRRLIAYLCAFEMVPTLWATRDRDGDIPPQFLADVATEHKKEYQHMARWSSSYAVVLPRKIDAQQYMVPEIAL